MKSLAKGRDISFPGWVLGTTSYCRRPSGFLVVTPIGFYCCEMPSLPPTRRDIPVERLKVVLTRAGSSSDAEYMDDWWVTECLNGDAKVLFACHQDDMRYVEHALSRRVDQVTDRA
jgi:hypothetical protein